MVINYPVHFGIDKSDPRAELWGAILKHVPEAKWINAYEEVARWLGDNKSRGLICVGSCGLGKSVICCQALPYLFERHFEIEAPLVVTAPDMTRRIDELLAFCGHNRIIIIDDLGTEAVETVTFGNRRKPFCELVDKAERTGTLLIITTNLRTTKHAQINYPSIEERYGEPTLDRLKAITHVVLFEGKSMRG